MEIASLQGRTAALRLAQEESAIRGAPWKAEDAAKYAGALAKDGATFRSDDLRLLLDEAMLASRRRVADAIHAVGKARVESEQADVNSVANLERAIHPLDHDARMTARAILAGCARAATKLRQAVGKLEVEARVAQSTHAADLRSVSAGAQAQREAIEGCLTAELRRIEGEGAFSLKALAAENAALVRTVQSRDLELQRQQIALDETSEALSSVRSLASADGEGAASTIQDLRQQVASLSSQLAESKARHHVEVGALMRQVAEDEEQEAAERAASAKREQGGDEMRRALALDYENRLAQLEARRQEEVQQLSARLESAGLDHRTYSAEATEKLKLLRFTKDGEIDALKKRVERLQQQLMAYRASSSSAGRAALYHANIKAAAGANKMGLGGSPPSKPPAGNWDGRSGAASLGREPGRVAGRFG